MNNLHEIRAFVVDNFLFGDGSRLKDESSFLEEGIVDSTGLLELIAFLEKTYGIKVEDRDIVPENMDSLARIAGYVGRKAGAAAPPPG
jgi:acyl carrier protein